MSVTLSFERQFVIAGHLLGAIGVAALATTHQVGGAYVLAALAALGWSLARELRGRGWQVPAKAANASMIAALAVILVPVVLQGASPIRAIAEFLLVLAALKFAAAKATRDWVQIYVLSFFHLLAASALTVEPIFALVFLAYLVLAPCVLVLALLRREVAEAAGTRRLAEETFVEPSLFRSLAGMTVVLFVSTLVIFILFPRMGAGYFATPFAGAAMLTGFSEEVGLGAVAALQQDDAVAMRVTVDRPDLFANRAIYWRGAALDHFDGRNWRRKPQEVRPLVRGAPGVFASRVAARRGPFVREEIILEPQDSSTVFFAGRPILVRGRFAEVSSDALGNLRVLRTTGIRMRYEVTASLAPRRTRPTEETLALPSVDPRIVALARSQTRGADDDAARAAALLRYLRRGFSYTLSPGSTEGDPLVRFLFDTKSGHCEYFASAYAVMLRAVGVPAIVVNGYAGGEWNPYGNYFLIRQRNAHSWVEAYVDGEWQVFDPTPPGEARARGLATRIADMIDAAQMRWYRYVVNYSLEDQAEAALSLRDIGRRFWEGLSGDWWKPSPERPEEAAAEQSGRRNWLWVGVGLLAMLVGWLWRSERRSRNDAEEALSRASRQYTRLLRALEGLGLGKRPEETAPEFCRRILPDLDGEAERFERLTSLYEEARFSGREVPAEPLDREIDIVIASLSRRVVEPPLGRD